MRGTTMAAIVADMSTRVGSCITEKSNIPVEI